MTFAWKGIELWKEKERTQIMWEKTQALDGKSRKTRQDSTVTVKVEEGGERAFFERRRHVQR